MAVCSVDECSRPSHARGWCTLHWSRWNRHGDPLKTLLPRRGNTPCLMDWCDNPQLTKGLCSTHYPTLQHRGVSYEWLINQREEQAGRCAICGEIPDRTLHIDHDHKCCNNEKRNCGECVRELLCPSCNQGLGAFKDNPSLMLKAAEYVKKHDRRIHGSS